MSDVTSIEGFGNPAQHGHLSPIRRDRYVIRLPFRRTTVFILRSAKSPVQSPGQQDSAVANPTAEERIAACSFIAYQYPPQLSSISVGKSAAPPAWWQGRGVILRWSHGELSRIGVAIDSGLLKKFDDLIAKRGYTNRSRPFATDPRGAVEQAWESRRKVGAR